MLHNKNKIENAESLEWNQVVEMLETRTDGLTSFEANKRLVQFGPNQLPEQDKINYFLLYLNQFKSFLILILIFAAIISFLLNFFLSSIFIYYKRKSIKNSLLIFFYFFVLFSV